jgi:hypothetical protein
MTPTTTDAKTLAAELRELANLIIMGSGNAMMHQAADRLEELELKNQIFRAAQKACEDCDAPRVDRIAELERELAAERALADRLASALADSAMWHAPPAYEAWREARRE